MVFGQYLSGLYWLYSPTLAFIKALLSDRLFRIQLVWVHPLTTLSLTLGVYDSCSQLNSRLWCLQPQLVTKPLRRSGIARTFPGGRHAYQQDQNGQKWGKFETNYRKKRKYFAVPGPLVSPAVAVCGWCKLTSDLDSHTC